MMGSASGVDHTFDYGMNSLELYLGKKNYFEGNVIYAEDDYKHCLLYTSDAADE